MRSVVRICAHACLLWCVLGGSVVHAKARLLRPGDVTSLVGAGSHSFELRIPVTGEYRIETKGEADTKCALYDRWRGLFASDHSSGVAKNCRLDLRLVKGAYRFVVQKGSAQAKVTLHQYTKAQPETIVEEGTLAKGSLKAGTLRAYSIRVKRRRWLTVRAMGETLHHCRLLARGGWVMDAKQTSRTLLHMGRHKIHRCSIARFVEPGLYKLELYGDRSTPAPDAKSTGDSIPKSEASVSVVYGAGVLTPYRWQSYTLTDDNVMDLWFQLPKGFLPKKKPFAFFYASGTARGWSLSLYRHGWGGRRGRQCIHRYGTHTGRGQSTLSMFHPIKAGRRYRLRINGEAGTKIRLFFAAMSAQPKLKISLGQRHNQLSLAGRLGEVFFDVKKDGTYWIEAQPKHVRSCVLEKLGKNRNQRIRVRSLRHEGGNEHRRTLQLVGGGMVEWIQIPADGMFEFGTQGRGDAYCVLMDQYGLTVESDDDDGPGRNCKIRRKLKAGLYRLQLRERYHKALSTKMYYSFSPSAAKTYVDSEGCSFQVKLKAGQYRLFTGQPGMHLIRSIGVFQLPLREKQIVRLRMFEGGRTLPVYLKKRSFHVAIRGVKHCILRFPGVAPIFGQLKGAHCVLKGHAPQSKGSLEIAQSVVDGGDIEIKMSPDASLQMAPLTPWKPKPLPFVMSPKPVRLRTYKKQFFHMKRHEERRFVWHAKRSGLYQIESLGLLKVGCTLQTEATTSLFSNQRGGPGDNCMMVQYMPAGRYLLRVKVLGRTRGHMGMLVKRLRAYSGQRLLAGEAIYNRLYSSVGRYHVFSVKKAREMNLKLQSLDQHILCRLERIGGWPLFGGNKCDWRGLLTPGNNGLWLYPALHTTRYRALLYDDDQKANIWPQTIHAVRTPRGKKVSSALKLFGTYHANLSPLGWDLYTLKIPTKMKLSLSLHVKGRRGSATQLLVRVFRGDVFIADSTQLQQRWLTPGTYKVLVQSRVGETGVRYTLRPKILLSTPGLRIWKSIPSTFSLRVEGRKRVDIETEGDADVWCQLYDKKGQLIAQNDNQSRTRWDCRISEVLSAGQYTLRVEGKGQGVWLDVQQRGVSKQTTITLNTPTTLSVPEQKIHVASFALSKVTALQFYSRAKSRIGCVLDDIQQRRSLGHSGGRRCQLFRLLVPGSYHWRIRSLEEERSRVKVSVKSIPSRALLLNEKASLSLASRKPSFLRFQVPHAGLYKLHVSGSTSTRCGLALQGGPLEWVPCNKRLSLSKGWYLWWMEHRGRGRKEASVHVAEEAMAGETLSVSLPPAQAQHYNIKLAEDGLYAFEISGKGSASWSCRIGAQRGVWWPGKRHPSLRCLVFATLRKGHHRLVLWRPEETSKQLSHGVIRVRRLGAIESTEKAPVWRTSFQEGTLEKHTQKAWTLTQAGTLKGSVTLHGRGVALLLSKKGVILASCRQDSEGVKTCHWKSVAAQSILRLFADVGQRLQYHIQLREGSPLPVRPLASGTHIQLSGDHLYGVSKWSLKGAGPTILEVVGQHVQCRVSQGLTYKKGCYQKLVLSSKGTTLSVSAHGHPVRMLLYKKGQRRAALWGKKIPGRVLTKLDGQREFVKGEALLLRSLEVKTKQVISLRWRGTSATCAFGRVGKAPLVVRRGSEGCELTLPLTPGRYWFGAYQERGYPLYGVLERLVGRVKAVGDGRHGPVLLGQQMSRWYQVDVGHKQKVGLGAVGAHEAMRCRLYDADFQRKSQDCMGYLTLPKGRYWFLVSLAKGAPATMMTFVVRGLRPPPKTPPAGYIKSLLGQRR
ncbi:MAG TPA: hypothetical protein DCE42_26555 [Myxococcales bacterium]|nr:hypothetical protein [Myxococcales bacterium]